MTNLPVFLLFFLVWCSSTAIISRILKSSLRNPFNWCLGFTVYWTLNLLFTYVTFLLPISAKATFLWSALLGTVILATSFYLYSNFTSLKKHKVLLLPLLLVLVTLGIWTVPVSDTDSISYVLPMVNTAHAQHNFGAGESFNFRSDARFWGVQAQLFNYTALTKNYTGSLSLNSFSYLFFALTLYVVARKFTRPAWSWIAVLLVLLNPFFLTAIFTVKDDIAFAGFLIVGGLLLPRQLSSAKLLLLFGLLGICLATSKVFYPVAFVTLVLGSFWLQPKKWKQYASIAFSLFVGLVCVWVLHTDRITNYQNTLESLTTHEIPVKARFGGWLGAAINELGVDLQSKSVNKEANGPELVGATSISMSEFLLQSNPRITYEALVNSKPGLPIYYYNYTAPNILVLVALTALLLVITNIRTSNNTKTWLRHKKAAFWVLGFTGIYMCLFLLAYSKPNPSNLRYLFAPIGLTSILGIVYLCNLNVKYLRVSLIGSLAVITLTLSFHLVRHPALTQSWSFFLQHKRAPSAMEVTNFNPRVEELKRNSRLTPTDGIALKNMFLKGEAVISAPLYPGFSAYSLFTYPEMPTTYEIIATKEKVMGLVKPSNAAALLGHRPAPIVIMSGAWNKGVGNLIPESSKDAVFESYQLKYNLGPNEIHILTK